jgi:hypothetical protein
MLWIVSTAIAGVLTTSKGTTTITAVLEAGIGPQSDSYCAISLGSVRAYKNGRENDEAYGGRDCTRWTRRC